MMIGKHTVIDDSVKLGKEVFIGNNVTIRGGCIIGDGVVVGHNTVIEEDVTIGEATRVQAQVYLARGTHIGRKVFIGPQVCTTNDKRILSHGRGVFIPNAPVIEDYVRIGAAALIFPGVVIRENALIGAGAKVVQDVHPKAVYFGGKAIHKGSVPSSEVIDE